MKYIIMYQTNGDLFNTEFNSREEALKKAEEDWKHLSAYDKKKASAFYVLESANEDEEAPNHFDGEVLRDYLTDVYTACRETGDVIDRFATIEEAKREIARYEERDQNDGTFEAHFYDIVDVFGNSLL